MQRTQGGKSYQKTHWKLNKLKEAEPGTPSTVLTPVSTNTEPSDIMFNCLQRHENDWKLFSTEPVEPMESFLDSEASQPSPSLGWLPQRCLRVHRKDKHNQVPVDTVLGLTHVRLAKVSTRRLPLSDMRIAGDLAHLSFHSPDSISSSPLVSSVMVDSPNGFPQGVVPADPTDVQAIVWFFESKRSVFASFRGNHDLVRFYTNMGLLETDDISGGRLTRGFVEDFKRIEVFLRPMLEQVAGQVERIVFVGAGLGGALATIAAPYFGQLLDRKVECITFGAPKVGNRRFAEWYNSLVHTTLRVVCSSDPLPHLPLNRPDFVHVCDSLRVSKNGYVELWAKDPKLSPKVAVTIHKIDFDDYRWELWANKYRKMVLAIIGRTNKDLATTQKHD